ncbi:MAG: ABC transporter ATP-binding protein, partial [Prevotella sp.]|nr:ABC transporter ATP-binding protein [Prevotella sp.]
RDFLDGLVDKVYEFGGGKVREHLGGIYEYLRFHNAENITDALGSGTAPKQEEQEKKTVANEHKDKDSALSYAERKEQQKKISRIQKQVKESEKRIEDMEAKLEELGKQLEQPENASDMTLVNKYTELQSALDEEMQKWEELSLQLE